MQHPNPSQSTLILWKQLLDQHHNDTPDILGTSSKLGRAVSQVFMTKKVKMILTVKIPLLLK